MSLTAWSMERSGWTEEKTSELLVLVFTAGPGVVGLVWGPNMKLSLVLPILGGPSRSITLSTTWGRNPSVFSLGIDTELEETVEVDDMLVNVVVDDNLGLFVLNLVVPGDFTLVTCSNGPEVVIFKSDNFSCESGMDNLSRMSSSLCTDTSSMSSLLVNIWSRPFSLSMLGLALNFFRASVSLSLLLLLSLNSFKASVNLSLLLNSILLFGCEPTEY